MAAKKNKHQNLDHTILLPGEELWELWRFDATRDTPEFNCIESDPDLAALAPRAKVLALPSRYVFSIPIWLTTTDESLIKDLLQVQLEKRGFRNRPNHNLIWDYTIVDRRETQTLVLSAILPHNLPASFTQFPEISHYPPLATIFPLAPQGLTLWKELGRWCVAASLQGKLSYFQDLGDTRLTSPTITQLVMLRHELYAEDVLPEIDVIQIYGIADQEELDAIGMAFDCSIHMRQRPLPEWHPDQSLILVPEPVQIARKARAIQKQRLLYLQIAAIIYLVFLSITTIYYAIISVQAHQIKKQQITKDPIVRKIQDTAKKWSVLEPAISPSHYPFELLWRASKALPEDGVRWTVFEFQDKKIIITGEAKNAPAASKYLDDLKQNPQLRDFSWVMPPPRLLPNDSAQFQIEGNRNASP
jgi:hypothetical protein